MQVICDSRDRSPTSRDQEFPTNGYFERCLSRPPLEISSERVVIQMELLAFQAHITVDGVELPQYDVKVDESTKTASCWIPSEAGKSFAVKWRHLEPCPLRISGRVHLDGKRIGGWIADEGCTPVFTFDSIITSSTTTRPLLFTTIQLTDDDTYLQPDNSKDLGDIVLKLIHVEVTGRYTAPVSNLAVDDKVHERVKKALVHRTTFGKENVERDAIEVMGTRDVAVLATFKFRYRSIDVLRADGIAPPDPNIQKSRGRKRKVGESDVPGEERGTEDEEEEREQAELKALLARIDVLQSNLAKKRSEAKGAKKVKVEPTTRDPFVPGEVIDLT
ncbi:hypothetical protein LshimejAT787_0805540 [Lyophyllum shimeji]|uniref:DUF7918 domain-containing protein n=1 Tax=Lyophyllum shimeji TaxID=47721 RepID=A0A9P3PSC5_LYOSH|nr:hypothetical protein LshimejAT787_0805540 [Lyophyllum shimeji]